MKNAPVERRHREWALVAGGETRDPADVIDGDKLPPEDLADAYHWLDTGEVSEEKLSACSLDEKLALELVVKSAQAFANFEFEIRTETDAALKESKEHAKLLDERWFVFNNISLNALRAVLELDGAASVGAMVEEIIKLKGVARS